MKKYAGNLFILLSLFLFCLTFSIILYFTGQNALENTPVRKKNLSDVSVNTVSVLDVKGVMKMTAFNYLPNEFAELGEVVSDASDAGTPAKRGTYRFYIDTLTIDEWAESDSLSHLLKPDGNWHLTMYIPPVFSACSVFVQYQNKDYVGSIDRYNIEYYTNYSSPSEFDDTISHRVATKPMLIDITISSDNKFSRECAVTIHYEADNDNFVGITDGILIGEDAAVRKIVTENRSVLLIGAIVGAATLLLFLLICILKRSFSFIPQLLFAVGVFTALFSTYLLFGFTSAPYLLLGIRRFSVGFILFSSTLYLPGKIGKIPVLYPAGAVAVAATALAFLSPFCTTVSAYTAVCRFYVALAFLSMIAVFGFAVRDIYRQKPIGFRLNSMIAGALTVSAFFMNRSFPLILLSPAFWLCIGMTVITLILGLREFIYAEIRNRYLTTNLKQEVERQTRSLQNLLSERDKILLYVSHDMKRTVVAMNGCLTDLRQNLSSPELIAKADSLLQKNAALKKDFADLGKYGRQNYVAEQSEVFNLSEIVNEVSDDLRPDYEANGILLKVLLPEKLDVYAKKVALKSVILNLILNAIEHSFCTHLTVTAVKRKGMCRLDIVDDGRGVTTDKNIFDPFVSGDPSENNSGLGLFLAKNAVESMHGKLTYERKDACTIFSATLPLA